MEEAHGAMGCYLYMTLCIVVFVLVVCIDLFFAEWLFPKTVHVFNYSLSARTFVELKAAHKYKAAADFYEQKKEILTSYSNKYENMMEVFGCYKRIGEYEKAEAILRDIYNLKYRTEKELKELEKEPWQKDFFRLSIAKEFFNLYEEMGDRDGQKRYYGIMQECLTPEVKRKVEEFQSEAGFENDIPLEKLTRIYDLKMLLLESPEEAISQMVDFLNEIGNSDEYKPPFILKCMNLLNNWTIERYGVLPAYTYICNAVEYALNTDSYNTDKSEYGNLSDICYKVHDIKNSKHFYTIYTTYLKASTSEDDPRYIDNRVRGFKFIEAEQNWLELESQVIDCCTSLRDLLGKNLQTMSESQREHFVDLLDRPFDYAANLLYNHPSAALASLCFENSIFMKGLLLRSNREMANKIQNSGDASLLAKYEQLLEYRKELSYREGLGNVGNAIRMNNLRKDIDALDKELAISCKDYRIVQENALASIKSISRSLAAGVAIVDFIQTDTDNLLALILTSEGKVKSVRLGTKAELVDMFSLNPRRAYTNTSLTDMVWSPVESFLPDITDVYYTANGIFNSISFQALALRGHSHLIDKYRFHLLSNISNIINVHNEQSTPASRLLLAMWGDVDYGGKQKSENDDGSIYRDIERGETLRHLTFSKDEIDAIQSIVERNNGTVIVFTDTLATEASFRSRAGKRDNILHISTHGFFSEDDAHRKEYDPMYNSGLFFAGADYTWNHVDTVFVSSAMLDDGILRADEIQYLDFSGCDLAVLSACKTGLGQSKNTEGVYGLQRAFKLAGVDKILMSLWSVNDRCTSELMQEFYKNYYAGMPDEEALRKAQSAIRERYPSPEDWGSFVLLY